MITQRLVLDGGYPDGVWTCAWCAAELAGKGIAHREDCRWVAEVCAEAVTAERERCAKLVLSLKPQAQSRSDLLDYVADLIREAQP